MRQLQRQLLRGMFALLFRSGWHLHGKRLTRTENAESVPDLAELSGRMTFRAFWLLLSPMSNGFCGIQSLLDLVECLNVDKFEHI